MLCLAIMNQPSNYKEIWKELLEEKGVPSRCSGVIEISYNEFKNLSDKFDLKKARELVSNFIDGKVLLVKSAFSVDQVKDVKSKVKKFWKENPDTYHKMIEGCPDFHRVIRPELAKNYALRQIKHAYYFFSWNDDPFNLFEPIYQRWSIFKFLGGFQLNEYEKNIPSVGVVDRLQIVQYPAGIGELEVHSDPYLHQKMAISGIMSKKGTDYQTGGAYILNSQGEKVDAEDDLDIGDIYIVYPTVFHGVETIDKKRDVDWDSFGGRWFMGLYSNASDVYAKRHTCYGVENTINSERAKALGPL